MKKLNIKHQVNYLIFILIFISISSCQVCRFVFYNFADINDHKKFQSRILKADTIKYHFLTTDFGKFPKTLNNVEFNKFLEENKTVAFLIIKNDTVQYEKYFKGYNYASIVPSFSMAKSITSILVGCAIDEGLIKSVDEPITVYIPELEIAYLSRLSVNHVSKVAAQYIYFMQKGYLKTINDPRKEFLKLIWLEMVTYLCSKIANP